MKFWFGSTGWGWHLYGVSYKDEWFFGFSRNALGIDVDELLRRITTEEVK